MDAWWSAMDGLLKTFYIIAISSSIVMVLQTILLFIGFGHGEADAGSLDHGVDLDNDMDFDHDLDHDLDHDTDHGAGDHGDAHHGGGHDSGLRVLTVRGLVAFFAVGGWVGVVMLGNGAPQWVSVMVSLVCGTAALYGIAVLFKLSLRLQSDGAVSIHNAVGKMGQVYIPIPAEGKGMGKVMVTVQERLSEFDAITREKKKLASGEYVRVTEALGGNVLVVERELGG